MDGAVCNRFFLSCPQSCSNCANDDISSFGTLENLFQTEEQTTTRYILSGRRCDVHRHTFGRTLLSDG